MKKVKELNIENEIILKFIKEKEYVNGMGMMNSQMLYKSLFEIIKDYEKFKNIKK